MTKRQLWFVTRPERDPRYHAEAVQLLAKATENFTVKWNGNREAHKNYEQVLADAGLKRNNISADGSGGRTWCAMLKTFAYCYIDLEGDVKPTKVGQALINEDKEYENVKKQILTLQIPNAYFMESGFRPKFDDGFKIRPARFLIRLVQSKELEYYVTKEEITYFVLKAKRDNDYNNVIQEILEYRNSCIEAQEKMKEDIAVEIDHRKRSDHAARNYYQAHSDVAHTFMMLCEYTDLVTYERGEAKLFTQQELLDDAAEVLQLYDERYPFNNRYLISYERMAQNNGLDVDSYKASSYGNIKPATNQTKRDIKVEKIRSTIPNQVDMCKEELATYFTSSFGKKEANEIAERLVQLKPDYSTVNGGFVERYLGELTPAEFEKETVKVLEAIGFDVIYQPKVNGKNTEIEIFVSYQGKHCGIIDTKHYPTGFSLSQNWANYMGSEYVVNYLKYGPETLSFYGYVTSEEFKGETKLKSITKLAGKLTGEHIEGFMITRNTLLEFLDSCLENSIVKDARIAHFLSLIKNQGIKNI